MPDLILLAVALMDTVIANVAIVLLFYLNHYLDG